MFRFKKVIDDPLKYQDGKITQMKIYKMMRSIRFDDMGRKSNPVIRILLFSLTPSNPGTKEQTKNLTDY